MARIKCLACAYEFEISGKASYQRGPIRWVRSRSGGQVQKCRGCGNATKLNIIGQERGLRVFPNKMTTRQACVDRYGHIDFASRHWGEQAYWLKMFKVQEDWFPNWKVLDSQQRVHAIACNLDLHGPLTKALTAVHAFGLGGLLHTFDGCFNIRMVRGSNDHFSAHSYGLALDLNASENPLGATHGGFYNHPDFVKCFTDQGFAWGGNFHGRKDPMHFSYCFEG